MTAATDDVETVVDDSPGSELSGIRYLPGTGRFGSWARRHPVDVAAVLVIVAATALKSIAVYRGYFYADDWHMQAVIANDGNDAQRVFGAYGSHLIPGAWLLNGAILAAFGPIPWVWSNAVGIAVFVLAGAATWLAVRAYVGPRAWAVVALAVPVLGALTLAASAWQIVWMTVYPVWLASAVALWGQAHLVRTGRRRWFVVSLCAFVGGLFFLEKALLIPLELLAVTAFWFVRGPVVRSVLLVLRRLWWEWGALALVGGAYLVYFLVASKESRQYPDVFVWIHTFWVAFLQTLPTALVGGPWQWADLGQPLGTPVPPPLLLAAAVAGTGGLVWLSARYRRSGLRMWAPFALVSFVVMCLVVVGRGSGGYTIGLTYYYFADLGALLSTTLAVCLLPLRGESTVDTGRRGDRVWRFVTRPVVLVAAAAVVSGGVVWTTNGFADQWSTNRSRTYTENLMAALEQRPDVALFDSLTQNDIYYMLWAEDPYKLTSRFMKVYPRQPRWVTTSPTLDVIAPDGRIVEGTVSGTPVPPGPNGDCGYLAKPTVVIPTGKDTFPWLRVMQFNYLSSTDTDATVDFGGSRTTVRFTRGPNELYALTEGGGTSVVVTLDDPDGAVCISRLVIGDQVPK